MNPLKFESIDATYWNIKDEVFVKIFIWTHDIKDAIYLERSKTFRIAQITLHMLEPLKLI